MSILAAAAGGMIGYLVKKESRAQPSACPASRLGDAGHKASHTATAQRPQPPFAPHP